LARRSPICISSTIAPLTSSSVDTGYLWRSMANGIEREQLSVT
jgi:hypothetical protein